MKILIVALVLATATFGASDSAALAQTANSSPTSPGAAGDASTAGSSTGDMMPKAGASKIGAPTPAEQKEQTKSDKVMNICKGC